MCYNNCIYEHFNPVTGTCTCHRGKNPCPEEYELVFCRECDEQVEVPVGEETCPECGTDFKRSNL